MRRGSFAELLLASLSRRLLPLMISESHAHAREQLMAIEAERYGLRSG